MPERHVQISVLDEVGERDAPAGSRSWALWLISQAKLRRDELERDASSLRRLIVKMQKHEAWKALGIPSFDMLCITQLQLSAEEVASVLKARKGQALGAVIKKARDTKEKQQGRRNDLTSDKLAEVDRSGTSNRNVLRRLARDNPELLDAIESGELSVNQAAIRAGIRKKPTPLQELLRAWKKATQEERTEFMKRKEEV